MEQRDTHTLKAYIADVARRPRVTDSELYDLYEQWKSGDDDAMQKIVEANLRLVISIAREYENNGVPFMDIIQEGNLGLMKGARRFDHKRGFKFSTYVVHWIRQSIRRSLTDTSRTVRLPAHIVGLLPKIRAIIAECNADATKITPEAIAMKLGNGATPETVRAALGGSGFVMSTDPCDGSDTQVRGLQRSIVEQHMRDAMPNSDVDLEDLLARKELNEIVRGSLHQLTPREERIMRLRFGLIEDPTDDEGQWAASDDVRHALEARANSIRSRGSDK